jgi:hypothetical protein
LYLKTNNKAFLKMMVIGLILIPVGTYALEKLQLNVTTKIVIEEKYAVSYAYWTYLSEDELDDYKTVLTENEYYQNDYIYDDYIVDGVKYKRYFVEELDGYYAPGSEVTMTSSTQRILSCNGDNWEGTDEEGYTCTSASITEEVLSYWTYYNNDGEYTYVELPMKFTMPTHNVSFNEAIPE